MNFFLRENADKLADGSYRARTLHDFLDNCPKRHRERHPNLGLIIRTFCTGLIDDGQLFSVGFDPEQDLPYSERFISYFYLPELADYRSYDFSALGYMEVRRCFENSVIRLGVTQRPTENLLMDGEQAGTAFLIEGNRMVTAAHCLPPNSEIKISEWDWRKAPLKSIKCLGETDPSRPCFLTRSRKDLAILEFQADPFPNSRKFKLWGGEILEDCLVMGYPNMLSFEGLQIAGSGQIVGMSFTRVRAQDLMIIDARVKGGNSGGPVISRLGKVMGVITNALPDEEQSISELGYGLATPAQTLLNLILRINEDSEEILEIPFEVETDTGIIKIKGL